MQAMQLSDVHLLQAMNRFGTIKTMQMATGRGHCIVNFSTRQNAEDAVMYLAQAPSGLVAAALAHPKPTTHVYLRAKAWGKTSEPAVAALLVGQRGLTEVDIHDDCAVVKFETVEQASALFYRVVEFETVEQASALFYRVITEFSRDWDADFQAKHTLAEIHAVWQADGAGGQSDTRLERLYQKLQGSQAGARRRELTMTKLTVQALKQAVAVVPRQPLSLLSIATAIGCFD
ncbi:hypothetical protein T484DRAFT_1793024 [Baffinella frigidus]|nr:hypothetical protein T484DRAFT_1793024 [Cryptophyta sp. CCMP2293]